ncbi:hypothetical protein LXA43DRAFT_379927 [Ganoderma leucocontextum]|nr:hypothetical protein LXA43DRAFT_379927 [Ganoderma leucocontextum]
MSSIFASRRKQHRPVPIANVYGDPWGLRRDGLTDDTQASTSKSTAAVRIMSTVRRFSYNSPRKRERGHSELERGMYSTPAESSPPTPSAFSFHDRPDTRPTIEQIAMGLHISRTPHLPPRPSSQPPHSHHLSRRSVDASPGRSPFRPSLPSRRTSLPASASGFPILPPPPTRSSLKKTVRPPTAESAMLAPSASDASLSTLTSNGPSTPRSVRSAPATSFPGRLRLEMLRLLPSRKGSLSGSSSSRSDSPGVMTPSSDADSLSSGGGITPRRKAVRFSTGVPE